MQLQLKNDRYNILQLKGEEAISSPFYFDTTILFNNDFDYKQYLLQPAQLIWDNDNRIIPGTITQIKNQGIYDENNCILTIKIQPKLILLEQQNSDKIFSQFTVIEIIKKLLLKNGYFEQQLHWHLNEIYLPQAFITAPPDENDFNFISRLLTQYGINYYFDTNLQTLGEIIHFYDQPFYEKISNIFHYQPKSDRYSNQTDLKNIKFLNKSAVTQIEIIDHDETQPSQKIFSQKNNDASNIKQTYYGVSLANDQAVDHTAALYLNAESAKSQGFLAQSDYPKLSSGKIMTIKADHLTKKLNGDYLIEKIIHYFQQNIQQTNYDGVYTQQLYLLPSNINYYKQPILGNNFTKNLYATIKSSGKKPQLDQQGRYLFNYKYCDDNSNFPYFSVEKLSFYGGNINNSQYSQVGFHTPLYPGCTILLSHIHGDSNRPVIIGSLPTSQQISPTTAHNHTQHHFKSQGGHGIYFDDQKHQEKIFIGTHHAAQQLLMDMNVEHPVLSLLAQQGEILWQSQQILQIRNEKNCHETIGVSRYNITTNQHLTQTQQGDLHQQSGSAINLSAKNNSVHTANENCEFIAEKSLFLNTRKDLNITAQGTNINLNANNSDFKMSSANHILITSNGNGNIELNVLGANIIIGNDGIIRITAGIINAQASNQLKFLGSVNYG